MAMNDKQMAEMERVVREATEAIHDKIPRAIAVLAKNHYREGFRQGGFVDGGAKPWKSTWRQELGVGAEKGYKPLTSRTNTLMNSIDTDVNDKSVRIHSDLDYSLIHNEGGDIPITSKMRRFFWAKFYEQAGKQAGKTKGKHKPRKIPPKARKWLALALAARKKKSFHIDQRMYIGESKQLDEKITKKIEQIINQIIK